MQINAIICYCFSHLIGLLSVAWLSLLYKFTRLFYLFSVSLWRRANARNVRLYYPYWQYTDLFIFRFIRSSSYRNHHFEGYKMATIFLNLTNRQKPQQIETVHTGKLKFLGYSPSEILLKQLVTSVLVIIVMVNIRW